MSVEDGILDPAHADDGGIENVGAAGIPKPDKVDDKPELKVSDDGNIAEHNGIKYVRQEALHNERKERQKLADTLASLDPVMPEFEQFLKAKETRKQSAAGVLQSSSGEFYDRKGMTDESAYLDEVATALGYYDDEGKPNLRRAQAHLNVTRREAQRETTRQVEPVARSGRQESARVNRERAAGNKFVDGQPVADQKYLDAAFNSLGEDMLADPNVANLAQVVAAGLEYLDHRKNGTLPQRRQAQSRREPMMVEGSTGRFDGDNGEMSQLDIAAARARGKTPEQWAKLSKQINTRNVLEDV